MCVCVCVCARTSCGEGSEKLRGRPNSLPCERSVKVTVVAASHAAWDFAIDDLVALVELKKLESDVSCIGSRFPKVAKVLYAVHAARQRAVCCCRRAAQMALPAFRGPRNRRQHLEKG